MKKVIFSIILIIIFVGIYPVVNDSNWSNNVKAIKGIVYLDNYNFNQNGSVNISGEWELYTNKLLNPEQIKNKKPDKYLNIPDKFTNQLNGKNTGYMTIHFKMYLPEGTIYGLRIESFLSAYKVWVNGVLQSQVGEVGRNYEEEKSIYLPSYLYFTAENGTVDIVIQASNYRALYPAFKPMELGLKNKIMDRFILNVSGDLIIIGGLFIVELLFLCLYKYFKNNKSFLYFTILCLFTQLRCLFLNERIIVHMFPYMPFEVLSKTAALTFYLFVPIYVLFLKELFPDLPKRLVTASFCFSIPFTIICIITSNTVYDRLAILGQVILFVIMADILVFLIKKSKEKKGAISFMAFIALVVTTINDILVNNRIIYGRYGFQVGMFVFAFLEVYIIIMKYSIDIIKAEKLRTENKIIYEKSIRDDLTNLYKRNYIDNMLNDAIEKYVSEGAVFSVIMFDIDSFKMINDNFGHLIGDSVLINVSTIILDCVGSAGYAGRYGGDEFIIILTDASKQKAKEIAEKIRAGIYNYHWEDSIKVTISCGVYENKSHLSRECIKNVDELLYKAKNNGRNRIEM